MIKWLIQMKAENQIHGGYKPRGAAFEVSNERGHGVAGPQPGGLPEISRGLSASDTPRNTVEQEPHPGGVPELFRVLAPRPTARTSGTLSGCIPIALAVRGCRLTPFGSTPG